MNRETKFTTPTTNASRRVFLGGIAATAALGTSTLSRSSAAQESAGKKIRIGVVGGRFGCSFYWHLHPNCTVAAVSDLRADRLQALVNTYKCDKTYPSLEELVKDRNIDAVGVFTGAPDHFRHVMEVLRHGKHVISAVPACMTLEECDQLVAEVKKTGLTYMMAETSYYVQEVMTARRMFERGDFGELFCCEAEYHHDGLETLFWEDGTPASPRTWRYGFPPMHYPTHSTAMLTGVTGERLVEVSCLGWGDDSQILKDNVYKNPYWSETAFFKTDRGHACRIGVYWKVAAGGTERAKWFGSKQSFHMAHPNGLGPILAEGSGKLSAFTQPDYWKTELPEPLRVPSGHGGSHTFLTHEFIDALVNDRRPAVDIYEAVSYTAPGIVAHQSALKGGEQMKVPQWGRPA